MLATFQACRMCFLFLDVPFFKRRLLGSLSHVCYVSGLPQAFCFPKNDMPVLKKVSFGPELTFLANIDQYLSNTCQYLLMYVPSLS